VVVVAGRLLSIGAVTVDYRRPNLKWTSSPGNKGVRECSISGLIPLNAAHELSELIASPAEFRTIGGFAGSLQWVVFDGDVLLPFTGYYLISSFDIDIERELMFGGTTGPTGFSLSAAFFGDLG
jgi:hypothetical protein